MSSPEQLEAYSTACNVGYLSSGWINDNGQTTSSAADATVTVHSNSYYQRRNDVIAKLQVDVSTSAAKDFSLSES